MQRPNFLANHSRTPKELITAFRTLPKSEAAEVDQWLLWAQAYGSMSWQEDHLFAWINDQEDGIHSEAADWRRGGHGA
jgi:hypothetical protein